MSYYKKTYAYKCGITKKRFKELAIECVRLNITFNTKEEAYEELKKSLKPNEIEFLAMAGMHKLTRSLAKVFA